MYDLTELMALDVRQSDRDLPVRALFHDPSTLRLSRVVVDLGGWLETDEVAIAIDRFDAPQAGIWPLPLDDAAITTAPHIRTEAERGAMSSLPPIVIGPFGSTYSPLLMGAQLLGMSGGKDDAPPTTPDVTARLDRTDAWLGREAFNDTGLLGQVTDVEIDAEWRLHALRLSDGRTLPLSQLRRIGEGGYFVFA